MSDQEQEALLSLLGDVNNLLEGMPEGAAIFEKLRSGELTPDDAVRQLADMAREAGLLKQLTEASERVNALVPGGPLTPDKLKEANRPIAMKTSTGIDQLNPVYEAAIVERVYLDGDVPELRSGTLPKEGRPAVPVITTSRDPVIIGLMLERASNEVHTEYRKAIEEHRDLCQRLLEDAEEDAQADGRDVTTALELTKEKLPLLPIGVSGYEGGKLPALRAVTPPDPHVTAVMNEDLRRVAIYKVLSTTQGRTSVAPVIESAVRDYLEKKGIPLNEGDPEHNPDRSNGFTWAVQVFGPEDLSDNFNPIQVAIEHLSNQLLVVATGLHRAEDLSYVHPEGGWAIRVTPYNDGISSRRFGWTARIGKTEASC